MKRTLLYLLVFALVSGACGFTPNFNFKYSGHKVEFFPTAKATGSATKEAGSSSGGVPSTPAAPPSTATPAPPPLTTIPGSVSDLQTAIEAVYAQVSPSVVNLVVLRKSSGTSALLPEEMPFKLPTPQGPEAPGDGLEEATGSGFVWDKTGYIITNNHVIEDAQKVTVTFADGAELEGEVVGADRDSDLAVVKISPTFDLQPVAIGDSTSLKVGQIVIAIGSPYSLSGTMTQGIISALGRSLPVESTASVSGSFTIPNVIQTDAAINPGNSGGVLMDLEGRLVGVTTAIRSPVRGNVGIGFAIPAATVQKVVPALIRDGKYIHTWLGVSGRPLTPALAKVMNLKAGQRGALVNQVLSGGPADKAGVKSSTRSVEIDGIKTAVGGDVIISFDGKPVKSMDDLIRYVNDGNVGQAVTLEIIRDGRTETVKATLEARPATPGNQAAVPPDKEPAQARLGVQGTTLTAEIAKEMKLPEETQGVLVVEVESASPADKAGLKGSSKTATLNGKEVPIGGDVITLFDGVPVTKFEELRSEVQQHKPGDVVKLKVLRDGEEIEINVAF